MTEEAFYLEVGIMIMLSSFPHFCKIIGYTENPKSLILTFYSSGSLKEWIQNNPYNSNVAVKIMSEVSSAVRTLHSNFLAHCDLKTQNILVEVTSGVPSFFLTDFGITQVLSDRIISSRMFTVISMKGISVQFASPESFEKFRSKNYTNVDYKKFDIYSFSCVMYEVLTRSAPWK
jgi:serine/threonine protein kinase